MKPAKCPNCGANINVDESKDAGICEFCNTPFVTGKALSFVSNTSNNAQTIINNYYNTPGPSNNNNYNTPGPSNNNNYPINNNQNTQQIDIPRRPRICVLLAIFLLYLYVIPGIIYICSVKKRQRRWDAKYNNKK